MLVRNLTVSKTKAQETSSQLLSQKQSRCLTCKKQMAKINQDKPNAVTNANLNLKRSFALTILKIRKVLSDHLTLKRKK